MRKTKGKDDSRVIASARDLRKYVQGLVRSRLKTGEDRERLAKALGLSVAAVGAMAYRGVGSFETFVGAILFLYPVDIEELKSYLPGVAGRGRRQKPLRESDTIWFELDEVLTEEEKTYWASMIRAATEINLVIAKMKKGKRKRKQVHPGGSGAKPTKQT